jgi:effector-binding domain-containing protein
LINKEIEQRKVVKQMNEYEVIEKTLDPVQVISLRYKGVYSDCGQYMGQLYKQAKSGAKDVPFNLYYDRDYQEEADIEVCVPVKKEIVVTGDVKCYLLPEKKGISVIHVGPYDTLGDAYQALADYASEKGLETKIPGREIYRKGPGMLFLGNTNKYVTEIFLELE